MAQRCGRRPPAICTISVFDQQTATIGHGVASAPAEVYNMLQARVIANHFVQKAGEAMRRTSGGGRKEKDVASNLQEGLFLERKHLLSIIIYR
jgi:hypothetical protein